MSKAKPGMLIQAKEKHDLKLNHCVVIGDVGSDMLAGHAVGAMTILDGLGKSLFRGI